MDQYGGEKKSKKTKKTTKTTKTTKSTKDSTKSKTKKSTKTTKTRSKAKGGNFLGSVGDLVAPTGWGPFATAAGLLALDRADAALRRGTKEKKEKMKGGQKMKGGLKEECRVESHVKSANAVPIQFNLHDLFESNININKKIKEKFIKDYYNNKKTFSFSDMMTIYYINNTDNTYSLKITAIFSNSNRKGEFSHCFTNLRFNTIQEAINYAKDPKKQMLLGVILVREYARTKGISIPSNYFGNLTSLSTSS
jgi:hypothetical protein